MASDRHWHIAASKSWLIPTMMVVLGIPPIYFLVGNQREATELSTHNVQSSEASGSHMYVVERFIPDACQYSNTLPFCIGNARLMDSAAWDQIDKHTLEIAQADDQTYMNLQDLADELPDHTPRYVLLSYPLTLVRLWSVLGLLDVQLLTPF